MARRDTLDGVGANQKPNAALWLDKYFKPGESGGAPEKKALLEELRSIGVPDGYPQAYAWRLRELESLRDQRRALVALGSVDGRMIVGLGAKGVVEVGIRLEHTWGVPYIPGSALKGLAAAAAHKLVGGDWSRRDDVPSLAGGKGRPPTDFEWLFGTTENRGAVIFHDAWWVPDPAVATVPLDLDVMTVHHPDYYGGKSVAPSDFDSPTPIPFITSRGEYLIAIESDDEAWRKSAFELLRLGLAELGVGAKTSSGYGRLKLEVQLGEEERRRHEEEKARRDALARALPDLEAIGVGFKGEKGLCKDIAQRLLAMRAKVGDDAVLARATALFAPHRSVWKDWLKADKRTEEERWLAQALK